MRKAILNLLWVNCMCKVCSSHKKRSSNNSKFMVFVAMKLYQIYFTSDVLPNK